MSASLRIACEKKIAEFCIKALIKAGYSMKVFDGEEVVTGKLKAPIKTLNAMFSTDEDILMVFKDDEPEQFGFVSFIYGNDGFDVIHDYSTNLEPVMKSVCEYAETFE